VRGRETSLRRMNTTALGSTSVATVELPHPLTAAARVLLVGDVRLFRELLEQAFAAEAGFELVGAASGDVAAIAAGMAEPSVVVVDMASLTIPDGVHSLAMALPDAKIVGVGVPDDDDLIVALLESGASGYITAEQPFADLVTAVEAASNGELPCPPRLSAALARRIAVLASERRREPGNGPLTPRQREIASLIADGLSNKQIARRLLIEQATVKNHVHTILVKLGVSRRDQVGPRLDAL
jgi:two-component system, NarL family, nitrate/nitrite response regulator NarL